MAINEIILQMFLKTNIEGELISEIGNKFQILGPPWNNIFGHGEDEIWGNLATKGLSLFQGCH